MSSGVVNRDGFELTWFREGSGTPMLVLGSSKFYERYYPRAMREQFDMVFCDLRQWAPTPAGFDLTSITTETFTSDIEAIRESLGLEHPIVMGQSQHGWLALLYADRYPDRARGVIAIGTEPPGDVSPTSEEFFEADASAERKAAHSRNLATRPRFENPATSEEFIANYIAEDAWWWYDETFDCSPLWEGIWFNLAVAERMWADPTGDDFAVDAVPTLLALGRYDYPNPYVWWQRPLPASLTRRLYERSGHHPPFEQPEDFTQDVRRWARELS